VVWWLDYVCNNGGDTPGEDILPRVQLAEPPLMLAPQSLTLNQPPLPS
jgi:hypothetical protein